MKNLSEFMPIFEMGRPKGSKNKPKEWPNDVKKIENDPEIKNASTVDDIDLSKVKPMKNSDHGKELKGDDAKDKKKQTKGAWSVDSPGEKWEEELAEFIAKGGQKEFSKNERRIAKRLVTKHDFYVQGEAGWAKTSIIEAIAKRYGYHILTVYLDKAVASDLGGIPVPAKDEESGALYMNYSVPGWALYMMEHPNDKFLLFFDEMNQAQPDVLNALMPIVLKHVVCAVKFNNFIVGAAGNYNRENGAVQSIDENKPLRDRFKPIITWETHTADAWKSTFDYFHREFDSKIGKKLINKMEEMCEYWNSPRDMERVFLEDLPDMLEGRNNELYDIEDIVIDLEQVVWDDIDDSTVNSREYEKNMEELANMIYDWINNGGEKEEEKIEKPEQEEELSQEEQDARIEDNANMQIALERGYYDNDGEIFLCTVDNIVTCLFDPAQTGVTAEVLKKMIKKMKADGRAPKYETVDAGRADAKKNGWDVPEYANGKILLNGEVVEGFICPDHLTSQRKAAPKAAPKKQSHSKD